MKYEGTGNIFGHLFMAWLGLAGRGSLLVARSGFLANGGDDRAGCAHGRHCTDNPDLPFHKATGKNSLFRKTIALFQSNYRTSARREGGKTYREEKW